MSDRIAVVSNVSPVLRYIVWLCEHGYDWDEATRMANDVSYLAPDGVKQFRPECLAALPADVIAPKSTAHRRAEPSA